MARCATLGANCYCGKYFLVVSCSLLLCCWMLLLSSVCVIICLSSLLLYPVWSTHRETGARLSGVGTESKEAQEREEKAGPRSAIARRKWRAMTSSPPPPPPYSVFPSIFAHACTQLLHCDLINDVVAQSQCHSRYRATTVTMYCAQLKSLVLLRLVSSNF